MYYHRMGGTEVDVEISGYQRDDHDCLAFTADDVTVTIGVHEDNIIIEQPGDHDDPDCILISDVDVAEALAEGILAWTNYMRSR